VFSFLRQVFRGFTLVTLCVLLIPLTVFVVVIGAFIFLPLPANLPEARSSLPSQASHIYDVNGNQIATLQKFDVNIPIEQKDLPEVMKQATIASEDRNFYQHKGVDPRGIARALWTDLRSDKVVQGGSTITQQYVKLAYTNRERSLTRKIREAVLASQLDRQVDKDEILFSYLSEVYFGEGAYGIGAAAELYFQKSVNQLNASEAATLVGVIPAPSVYGPRQNLATAEARRKSVLQQMLQERYLDQQQHDDAVAHPLWLESNGDAPGPVTLIKSPRKNQTQFPYYVDYVTKYLVAKYGEDMTYSGGLRVQTTLDPALQELAERTIADRLKGTSAPLEMALVSVEPQTGFVRALVGGRDFSKAQVNLALGGCPTKDPKLKVQVEAACWTDPFVPGGGTGRQPGSSFKPFVLAAAYEEGVSPSKTYSGASVYRIPGCTVGRCTISNAEGEASGNTTIKEAMIHSLNTVYAPLGRDVGFPEVGNMAKKLGVQSAWYSKDFHRDSGTYSLGVIDVSPLEMAAAYGVFANRGVRQDATPVVKIIDTTGKVVEDNSAREGKRVISEAVADNVTDALVGVVERGTAAGSGIGRPAAGKTGTTDDFGDAWFVGYTPSLSTSVWMGNSTNNNTMSYKGNRRVYGGSVPAPTWSQFMKQALKDVPATEFSEPAPITKVNTNALQNTVSTIPVIEPQVTRQPKPLPSGDFDQTEGGTPVQTTAAPPTTTAPPLVNVPQARR
jgi:penicillin-binding protein 1A